MSLATVFGKRVRGVRMIDLFAVLCLTLLILGVYAFKAQAARETAQIADVDRQIADERLRVRVLRARLAQLEQPARLERLSANYLGLGPAPAKREAAPEGLSDLAHTQPPARATRP